MAEFSDHFDRTGVVSASCRSCGALVGMGEGGWKLHLAWHYALEDRLKDIASDASWGTMLRPIGPPPGSGMEDVKAAADRIINAVWPERPLSADNMEHPEGTE